jgi:hypothetical protein
VQFAILLSHIKVQDAKQISYSLFKNYPIHLFTANYDLPSMNDFCGTYLAQIFL